MFEPCLQRGNGETLAFVSLCASDVCCVQFGDLGPYPIDEKERGQEFHSILCVHADATQAI